jgi:phenylacetate-coenzyme A ligase PaaK-like adenylate-forming protein
MTERQVRLIADFEPDVIMVTPSYMLAILDEFERQGIDPRSSSLKVGNFVPSPGRTRSTLRRATCRTASAGSSSLPP